MKHAKRLQDLEDATAPDRGFRHYATNDDYEAAGLYLDCNGDTPLTRAALALHVAGYGSAPENAPDEIKPQLVKRERIESDEAAGYRVIIVKYTAHWRCTAETASGCR